MELYVNVVTIPAGHCVGSIMFLFITNKENILFTGDFRITENDVCKLGYLHDTHGAPLPIDVMYVDTTFIDKKYQNLPRRSTVIDQLMDIIKAWLTDDRNGVAISTSAKYGYEFVFNQIFEQLNYQVYVDEDRYDFYK